MNAISAIKADICQSVARHLTEENPQVKFGLASTAIAESLADMIFAAARDQAHGLRLLAICLEIIDSRWRQLASGQ